MAGLYDLDIDAKVVDDWAIQWDDPDASTGPSTFNVTITDSVGIADAASQVATYGRTVTDGVTVTDSASTVTAHDRTITDNVVIPDFHAKSLERPITDSVSITDSATASAFDIDTDIAEGGSLTNVLGCGKIGVYLATRADPTGIIRDLTADLVGGTRCGRVLNEVSEAHIVLKECYDGSTIEPWVHSLLFTWDGEYIWSGPVTRVRQDENNQGIVTAQDIMAWMKHRVLVDDYDSIGAAVDASAAFATVVSDGFNQDATVSYVITAAVTGISVERQWLADQFLYVRDVVDELVVTGSDWTTWLNTIYAGDVEASVVTSFVLNRGHMKTKPAVEYNGDDQANSIYVVGDDGIFDNEAAAAQITTYGLLHFVEHETDIKDAGSAEDRAAGVLDFRRVYPTLIEGIALLPVAPVTVNELIPGIEFALNVPGNVASYAGLARLQSVEIVEIEAEGRWGVTLHCNTLPVYA